MRSVEEMKRNLPAELQFQNERQRNSHLAGAFTRSSTAGPTRVSAGWAHAGATVGDPGGEHNYNPNFDGKNQANMYTIAWIAQAGQAVVLVHRWRETVNDGNAHFDIGAGGHGIKTDCHDGTNTVITDFSSAGPTTWGGCHELGVSTGVNYKF